MPNRNNPKPEGIIPPRPPTQRPGPAGGARDLNRRDRTRSICEAALALFLEGGIDIASIDHIARRAGIGKATFYSYFRDKEELVETLLAPFRDQAFAAMDRCLGRIEDATDYDDFRRAQELLAADVLPAFVANLDVLRLLLQESRAPATGARRPIRDAYDALVERAVSHNEAALRRGLIREIHPRVSAYMTLGAIERIGVGMLLGEELGDPAEAIRMVSGVLLDGLRRPGSS